MHQHVVGSVATPRRLQGASPLLRLLAALAAAALVATGCGEDRLSKEQYQQRVRDIGTRFDEASEKVFDPASFQNLESLREAGDQIREGAGLIDEAARELDGLAPPEEVQSAHDRMVQGFRELAGALRNFAVAAEEENLQEIQRFVERAQTADLPGMKKVLDAMREFESRGYDIDGQQE